MGWTRKNRRERLYIVSEKLTIVRETEEIGNRADGRKYDIPECCIT
jgi:hypothetical protein